MPPGNLVENTSDANVTAEGEQYFSAHGGPRRINRDFLRILDSGFYVLHIKPDSDQVLYGDEAIRSKLYEHLVYGDVAAYFDTTSSYSFFPERSRLPLADADSLGLFRQYAIGENETRFTTLRLAALLDTVTTGRRMRPFIVESVFDPALQVARHRVTVKPADVFTDLRSVLPDIEGVQTGNDRRMTEEMRKYLELVCTRGPGHTGWYLNANGKQVFMTEDNPATTDVREDITRRGGLGKTGTADYGKLDPFDDSVFVYKQGRYLIAVWLERADGPGVIHPAHEILNDLLTLIQKLEPPTP